MYSCGMVLGIGKNSGEAFLKAQEATGTPLPSEGTVFISVNDYDKSELVEVSRAFHTAGFSIVATRGCARLIENAGIPVEVVKKLYEGRPNVLDLMINQKIQIVINTPTDTESVADDSYIRKAAVKLSIAYMTTMAAAKAAAGGLTDKERA
jgi:carbamoyl-phosphate synthase large subunit